MPVHLLITLWHSINSRFPRFHRPKQHLTHPIRLNHRRRHHHRIAPPNTPHQINIDSNSNVQKIGWNLFVWNWIKINTKWYMLCPRINSNETVWNGPNWFGWDVNDDDDASEGERKSVRPSKLCQTCVGKYQNVRSNWNFLSLFFFCFFPKKKCLVISHSNRRSDTLFTFLSFFRRRFDGFPDQNNVC